MFVDADAIEAEAVRQDHLAHVALVKLMSDFGVVDRVGKVDPRGFVFLVIFGVMSIRHEMKVIELNIVRVAHEHYPPIKRLLALE